jgi:hypothetical protein
MEQSAVGEGGDGCILQGTEDVSKKLLSGQLQAFMALLDVFPQARCGKVPTPLPNLERENRKESNDAVGFGTGV